MFLLDERKAVVLFNSSGLLSPGSTATIVRAPGLECFSCISPDLAKTLKKLGKDDQSTTGTRDKLVAQIDSTHDPTSGW